MQKLFIAGNVGKDAEKRTLQSGDDVLNFSLAVDNGKDKNGEKRAATWYDCAIFGKRAASLERHITKGSKLALIGRPTARAHDGKVYLGITVDDLTFQGGSQRDDSRQQQSGGGGGYSDQSGFDDGLDDDVPFASNSPAFDLAGRVL